jgi:TPR repeat protein
LPSRQQRITGFLAQARAAAEVGEWVSAGRAWIEAAKLGNREGAEQVSKVAAPQIKLAADAGDIEAQALLAGILMDYYDASALPMAVEYAQRATGAGSVEALRTLGYMADEGLGMEQDAQRAADSYRRASDAGDGYAAFNLAGLHRKGTVKLGSEDECDRLLILAAERGVVMAGAVLGDRLSALDRDEEALHWYVWAAERGHVGSMFAAGCWYRDGFGTSRDPVQALRWYFTMFQHGNGDGIHEAHKLAAMGMSDEQILEAGRLAGDEAFGRSMVETRRRTEGHEGHSG